MRRAEEQQEEEPAPPTYALQADCFCEGAALARKRRSSTKPVLDFDARDPSTFGFQELGKVVGAHGVRGALRVDPGVAIHVHQMHAIVGAAGHLEAPDDLPWAVRAHQGPMASLGGGDGRPPTCRL